MRAEVQKVQRKMLPDQIVEQLLELISNGDLTVGDKLPPEKELMERFGVGRSSIREAMGALSLVGVVDVSPGRGTVITSIENPFREKLNLNSERSKYPKLEEIIEARTVLETSIAELAARRASQKEIDEIRDALARLKSARKNTNRRRHADLSFHLAIAKASGNSVLTKMFSDYQHLLRMWMEVQETKESETDIDTDINQHVKIFEAIEKKDIEAARSLVKELIERGYQLLADRFQETKRKIQTESPDVKGMSILSSR